MDGRREGFLILLNAAKNDYGIDGCNDLNYGLLLWWDDTWVWLDGNWEWVWLGVETECGKEREGKEGREGYTIQAGHATLNTKHLFVNNQSTMK